MGRSLSDGGAVVYKRTSERDTPSQIQPMDPTDLQPLRQLIRDPSRSRRILASVTACLLPDLDLASTSPQYEKENNDFRNREDLMSVRYHALDGQRGRKLETKWLRNNSISSKLQPISSVSEIDQWQEQNYQ